MKSLSICAAMACATLLLAGCRREAADATPAAAPTPTETNAQPRPSAPADTSSPATTSVGAFTVDVTLSPAAQTRLAEGKETIVVAASYFGTPTEAGQAQANEVGQIDLGQAQQELAAAGSARFDGSALAGDKLALVQGAPEVNINVYSGRKSSPDNLLDCGFFQDTLEVAAQAPIALACKLIGER